MNVLIRSMLTLIVVTLMFSAGAEQAVAQTYPDTVSIMQPTSNTTWVTGNHYEISASLSGSTPVSKMRVMIYNAGDSSIQYLYDTVAYTPTLLWEYDLTCPSTETIGYDVVDCVIKVQAIGQDGATVVGESTVTFHIAG